MPKAVVLLLLVGMLIALVTMTRAIDLVSVSVFPHLTYTRLEFSFDGEFEVAQKPAPEGGLRFVVATVGIGDILSLPDLSADRLVTGVSVEGTPQGLELCLATSIFADRFEAYATSDPDRLVVKVYRKLVNLEEYASLQRRLEAVRGMKILLVDDDDGINNGNILGGVDVDEIYEKILTENLITYDILRVGHGSAGPSYDKLKDYDCVIWFTGIDALPCLLCSADQSNLTGFLEGGGRLLLVSQNYLSELGVKNPTANLAFKMGICKIKADTQETDVFGAEGSFAWGLALDLDYRFRLGGNWGDGFEISDSSYSRAVLVGDDGRYYGLQGEVGRGNFVFFSVAFENASMPVDREELFLAALGWLTGK